MRGEGVDAPLCQAHITIQAFVRALEGLIHLHLELFLHWRELFKLTRSQVLTRQSLGGALCASSTYVKVLSEADALRRLHDVMLELIDQDSTCMKTM